MNGPIVVGVDGSGRGLRALMWAAHEAALRERPLLLIHVLPAWEGDVPLYPPGRFDLAQRHGHELLAEAEQMVRDAHPQLEISTALPQGTPVAALRQEAAEAELIALGAKGEDVGNVLLGSTAIQLVGHVDCPVAVVGHIASGHGVVSVGTDGSLHSEAALEFAFREASLRSARLHVIDALGLPQGWPKHLLLPEPPDDAASEKRRIELDHALAPFRARYPDVEVIEEVHHVSPIHALAQASERSDLLVLGSRGRGGFHGLALGSVTHKMLHFASSPVVVIRAQEKPAG